MSFTVGVYDGLLLDLTAGSFTSATPIGALLLNSAYVFSKSHTNIAAISGSEISGGGYARFGSATFVVNQVADEVQYQSLSTALTFTAFTTSDWRYVVLFNNTTSKLYLCVDTSITNTQAGTAMTLDSGTDPYLRIVSP